MLNTVNRRMLRRLSVVVMASAALLGAVSMQSAFALEKVNDAKLTEQMGAAQFFDGPCVASSPPACAGLTPVFSANCARNTTPADGHQNDNYRDALWPAYVCLGNPKPNPPHCNSRLHTVSTVQRRYYSLRAGGGCNDDPQNGNYSQTFWRCSAYDCRTILQINPTGQNVVQ